jgi:hypothetical protein
MLLNLSARRAGTILGGLALAAGAIVSAGPVALASSAKPNVAATTLCKTNGEEIYSNGGAQLWYSPTCRTAWGVTSGSWAAVGAQISVTNNNTGAHEENTVTVNGQRTVTAAVDDAGTTSYACWVTPPDVIHPKVYCTASF